MWGQPFICLWQICAFRNIVILDYIFFFAISLISLIYVRMKVVRREAAARGFAGNCCSCNWFLRSRPIHSCSTLRQHLLWKHFIFICFTVHPQLEKREQTWFIVSNNTRSGGVMTSSRFWVSLPKFNCNIRTSISAKPKKYQFNMFH